LDLWCCEKEELVFFEETVMKKALSMEVKMSPLVAAAAAAAAAAVGAGGGQRVLIERG
jgi:hypothetical protein